MPEEFVLKEIEENLKFVLYNIYPDKVSIHIDRGDKNSTDLPRAFYTYFTISRLWKNNLGNVRQNFNEKFWKQKLEEDIVMDAELETLFVCLYGMRASKNFGFSEPLDRLLNVFKNLNTKNIFSSAVSMYVFMSTYQEVPELRKDEFAESLYNNCLRGLELMLNRENIKSHPFYFSEFSYFYDKIPDYFWEEVKKYIKANFNREYLKGNLASSGVAKTLEHFANVGDIEGFNLGLEFLEPRKYKNLTGFKNTFLPNFDRIYTEHNDSIFVVLDTNLHLLNAYVNFYEKNI
jgi:hypothetical protein